MKPALNSTEKALFNSRTHASFAVVTNADGPSHGTNLDGKTLGGKTDGVTPTAIRYGTTNYDIGPDSTMPTPRKHGPYETPSPVLVGGDHEANSSNRAPIKQSLWRPQRPAHTDAMLYVTVTLAAAVGCLSTLRLFVGAGFALLITASVIVAIWVPFLGRLARIPWIVGFAASAGVESWLLLRWASESTAGTVRLIPGVLGNAPKTNLELLPRVSTELHRFGTLPGLRIPGDRVSITAAGHLVREALLQVNAIVPPAPMLVGFGLVVGGVTWIVGTLTEVFLGSFRARFEALLPMSVAAIASALLLSHTADPQRVRWIAAVGATCALHVVSVAAVERRAFGKWFTGAKPHSVRSAAGAFVVLGLLGATSLRVADKIAINRREPAIDWRVARASASDGPRTISSPLASMQRRLLQQSNREQFRVKALADGQAVASYWRQTSLSIFDSNEEWKGSGSYRRVKSSDSLGGTYTEGTGGSADANGTNRVGISLEQEIEIGALSDQQVPVAWEALSVKTIDSIDSSASTRGASPSSVGNEDPAAAPSQLLGISAGAATPTQKPKSIPPKPNLSFDEASDTLLLAKRPQPGQRYVVKSVVRRAVPSEVANAVTITDPSDPDLALPKIANRVRDLAERITVSQSSTVGKAKALQDYLRENYTYSLDVPETAAASPLEDFLFESKTGYCVQFAGSFAVLARSIGIPARLALGYTPGRLTEEGYFSVTGKNAHAWPEIRLADGRWVAFEPTPGRGNPDSESVTGVAPIDGSEIGSNDSVPTTTTTIPETNNQLSAPTVPETDTAAALGEKKPGDKFTMPWLMLLLVGFLFACVTFWYARRRQDIAIIVTDRTRRRLRSQDPVAQIDGLWLRVEERLGNRVSPRRDDETEIAFAKRASVVAPQVNGLAILAQRARYDAPATVNPEDAATAIELAEAIDATIAHRTGN